MIKIIIDTVRCYMRNKKPPFEITNQMIDQVAEIAELVGKISATFSLSINPTLRRSNRIRTIHGSLEMCIRDTSTMTAPSRHTPTYPLRNAFPVAAVSLLPNAAMGTGAKAV